MQAGREIKFRGKSVETGQWLYGSLCRTNPISIIPLGDNRFFEITPESVGEFTGLCDKNGKEIYEGDVLQDDNGKRYRIKWGVNSNGFIAKTNEAHCNVYSSYHLAPNTEVIGNIYENPKLLPAT